MSRSFAGDDVAVLGGVVGPVVDGFGRSTGRRTPARVTATARAVSRPAAGAPGYVVVGEREPDAPALGDGPLPRRRPPIRVAGDQPVPDDGREEREEGDDGNEGNSPRCIVRNMPRWAPTNAAARGRSRPPRQQDQQRRGCPEDHDGPVQGKHHPRHPRERVTDRRRELFEAHRVGEAVARSQTSPSCFIATLAAYITTT